MSAIKPYFVLCRLPISLFAACSALTGYFLAPSFDPLRMVLLAAGVLLLAAGASALNQYQERDIDALMDRTRLRPLPAGTLPSRIVLILSALLLATGAALLGAIDAVPTALGAFTVLWYNGLYTPLKRVTAFAAVPGALVGAIPPAMGWAAGGGDLGDPRVFALAMLFFLWQIPHFWLLLLRNSAQYDKAGLPTITSIIPRDQLARITLLWIVSAAVASLAMPLFGIARSPYAYSPLIVLTLWVSLSGRGIISTVSFATSLLPAFRHMNIFILLFMLLVVLDALLLRG